MTTLPTSLRRGLLFLLIAMSTIVMVFYWNQSALKPPTFMNGIFTKIEQNKLVGAVNYTNFPEKAWTYKCVSDKCVREHYLHEHNSNGEKRIPYMSCAMICGSPNIWPLPTIKTSLGSQSLTFQSHLMSLDIVTKFAEAKELLRQAFNIFQADLRSLEGSRPIAAVTSEEVSARSEHGESSSAKDSDRESHINGVKDCDIRDLDIRIEISTIKEVYQHMEMDESYELKITTHKDKLKIVISAKSFFGARNGLSTLQQLIWFDDEDDLLRILNKAHVKDAPKFRYRGLMLDTARNYFTVDAIKRTLVGMAHSKLNRFHWHLTDSQSFPYVSKAYPQLAKHGAYSSKEIYTSDDVKEIAEFARVRGIQVIPEIDAPAHAGNGWDWGKRSDGST